MTYTFKEVSLDKSVVMKIVQKDKDKKDIINSLKEVESFSYFWDNISIKCKNPRINCR
jgi:hypothetical protein